MLGFKAFDAAQAALTGIELMHMLRKQQTDRQNKRHFRIRTPAAHPRWRLFSPAAIAAPAAPRGNPPERRAAKCRAA
jgi:hypothetical protein